MARDAAASGLPPLARRLIAGEPAALARAISMVERGSAGAREILAAIAPHLGRARVVAFTGPPGVGKSTLINAFIREQRARGLSLGVLAVDPSSPLSGGAVLGDRIRMGEHTLDPGVFIRSLASRGALGGLSLAAMQVADLMDAAGRDMVIVETVGTGQSEVDVADLADICVVVAAPGLGDDMQAIKAGILEIADILVVNRADQPGADDTRRQLEAMLALRASDAAKVPVLLTDALAGTGLDALSDAVERCGTGKARRRSARALLARHVEHLLRKALREGDSPELDRLAEALRRGALAPDEAARAAVSTLTDKMNRRGYA